MMPRSVAACTPSRLTRGALRLLFTLLLATLGTTVQATTYLQRSPQQLALDADLVFVGTVSEQSMELDAGLPWTAVTFELEELLRDRDAESSPREEDEAPEPAERVTLRFLGGSASGQRLTVSGLPRYQRGERYLIFAYQRAGVASPLVGVRQGSWGIAVDGVKDADGAYLTVLEPGGLQRAASSADSSDLNTILAGLRALLSSGVAVEAPSAQPGTDEQTTGEPEAKAPASDEPEAPATAEAQAEPPASDEAEVEVPASDEQPLEPVPTGTDGAELEPEGAEIVTEPAAPLSVVYRVDDSGGPLALSSAVSAAVAAWEGAAPGAIHFSSEAPAVSADEPLTDNLIRYGAPTLLGLDALSLTLAREGDATTEVLVSPDAGSALAQVLLHELGVLAGLPEGGAGVMAFAIDTDLSEPSAADVAALLARRDFAPEDLNLDGVVDFYDLAAFGRAYGDTGVNLAADFNGDGRVDDDDLAILEAAYTFTPPSEQAPAAAD